MNLKRTRQHETSEWTTTITTGTLNIMSTVVNSTVDQATERLLAGLMATSAKTEKSITDDQAV